jgi:hypothetical protein
LRTVLAVAMLALRGLVRGYRRAVAQLVAPPACPICLDAVPVLGLKDAPRGGEYAFAKLRCKHKFCAGTKRTVRSVCSEAVS